MIQLVDLCEAIDIEAIYRRLSCGGHMMSDGCPAGQNVIGYGLYCTSFTSVTLR